MIEDLDAIVAKMRALGVSKYKSADLEIELGPEPAEISEPSEEERRHRREQAIVAMRDHVRKTMFAATSMRPRRGS